MLLHCNKGNLLTYLQNNTERLGQRRAAFKLQCIAIATFNRTFIIIIIIIIISSSSSSSSSSVLIEVRLLAKTLRAHLIPSIAEDILEQIDRATTEST